MLPGATAVTLPDASMDAIPELLLLQLPSWVVVFNVVDNPSQMVEAPVMVDAAGGPVMLKANGADRIQAPMVFV